MVSVVCGIVIDVVRTLNGVFEVKSVLTLVIAVLDGVVTVVWVFVDDVEVI